MERKASGDRRAAVAVLLCLEMLNSSVDISDNTDVRIKLGIDSGRRAYTIGLTVAALPLSLNCLAQ